MMRTLAIIVFRVLLACVCVCVLLVGIVVFVLLALLRTEK